MIAPVAASAPLYDLELAKQLISYDNKGIADAALLAFPDICNT